MSGGFIIEHPTRGVLVEQDVDFDGGSSSVYQDWRTKFSPTKSRLDAERFFTVEQVSRALGRIDPSVRALCKVLAWGTWEPVRDPH